MGLADKARNAAQNAAGKVKEATGKATGNDHLKNEGKGDQGKSSLKKAGENIKDAFRD
ncbi:CsbD family protein [Mycolicibacter sinensis]|uniref:General stress protein CsbD n=1 Tax=Mycolicibacter sinensis (strain JDM601) TaxID=875328 RepID=A0A1A3TJM0_MYCSD|nr:CsbD family protein [Mycolicibacter sinensis]MDD7813521.1 CsbD family protein [Mycobacterium sp. CSUR Q5927]OBK82905.1 general stress protein CsbD [Mycolicibacter sinensis]